LREAIYHDRNCYLEDGRPVGSGGGLGIVLATAGAGRAEGTAAARAEREGLRGHAGRRVARGENGGGCGARESLHWLVWGRREKERAERREGGWSEKAARRLRRASDGGKRVGEAARGRGKGFWLWGFLEGVWGEKG